MKKLGWILGGIYLVNGIIDLVGGKHAMKWMHHKMARKLPHPVGKALKRMTEVNPVALRTMGILNLVGGTGLVLATAVAAGLPMRRRRFLFWK